jgi:sugar/nucleoside kinase (ribokinase family)
MPTIVSIGEALVEIMRTERDKPLDRPAAFSGPYPSGAPAILASAAARLGASVGFVGSVGHDAFGRCIVQRLQADSVDCSGLAQRSARLTGIAFVAYRADGNRDFLFHLPQSAAAEVSFDQMPPGYLESARYLHIMGSALCTSQALRETCYRAARQIHEQGGTVSLDPNLRPELLPVDQIRQVCQPILDVAGIVMPSGAELATLTGQDDPNAGARWLLDRGVQLVALKRGAAGSTLFAPDQIIEVAPFQVTEVDPTGAGDCFDAAILVGLSEGWPLARVGQLANAVGALATTRLGPMEGASFRQDVLSFMREQGHPLD